jgi:hypothetical protein
MRTLFDYTSMDAASLRAQLDTRRLGPDEGALLTAWQVSALAESSGAPRASAQAVVIPDFLNYARLLNTGNGRAMLALPGSVGASLLALARASACFALRPARIARRDFWAIAECLARYDLALLPREFRGPVFLHHYLADFAFAFEQRAFVSRLLRSFPRAARRGFVTHQLPSALSHCARWGLRPDVCAFLCAPDDGEAMRVLRAARASAVFEGCEFLGNVSGLPPEVQDAAPEHLRFDAPIAGIIKLAVRSGQDGRI